MHPSGGATTQAGRQAGLLPLLLPLLLLLMGRMRIPSCDYSWVQLLINWRPALQIEET